MTASDPGGLESLGLAESISSGRSRRTDSRLAAGRPAESWPGFL